MNFATVETSDKIEKKMYQPENVEKFEAVSEKNLNTQNLIQSFLRVCVLGVVKNMLKYLERKNLKRKASKKWSKV